MTDGEIIGWLIAIFSFGAGYSLGYFRGQSAGIKWCLDFDRKMDQAFQSAKRYVGSL